MIFSAVIRILAQDFALVVQVQAQAVFLEFVEASSRSFAADNIACDTSTITGKDMVQKIGE
jgi:hypothetical protein